MVCLHGHSTHVLTAGVCFTNKVFSCINNSVKRIPADSNRQGDQLANLWPASLNVWVKAEKEEVCVCVCVCLLVPEV